MVQEHSYKENKTLDTNNSLFQAASESRTNVSSKIPSLAPKIRKMQNKQMNQDLMLDIRQNLNTQSEMAFNKPKKQNKNQPPNRWMGHD